MIRKQTAIPRNPQAWAIGRQTGHGFIVRRIVWGRLLAREEKREGEEVRSAFIYIDKAKAL